VRLNEMSETYEAQCQFLCIYIKEIHPNDEMPNSVNLADGIDVKQPATDDERAEIAGTCMLRYNYRFPMLLDNMTNQVEEDYLALPERLYLIDANGKIALCGGPGPHCFDVDELEKMIQKEIAKA
jgi:hypothetical protein